MDKIRGPLCHRCGKNRTKRTDNIGQPLCADCALEMKVEAEPKIDCPKCHKPMTKEVIADEVIIDRCSSCGGVWLDKGELDTIEDNLEGESGSNFALGIASGMAMGSALHH